MNRRTPPGTQAVPVTCRFLLIPLALTLVLYAVLASPAGHTDTLTPIAGEASEILPGKMVWADLLTTNIDSAAVFYREVFGWQTETSADSSYLTVYAQGKPIAAISAYEDDAPEGEAIWLASFSVADIEAAMSLAVARGGRQLAAAEELPGRGRVAVLQDPQGAVIGLMRATGGDPVDGGRIASNTFAWPELLTRDPDQASRYYQRLFDLEEEKVRTPDGAVNHVLGRDNIARSSVVVNPFPEVGNNWLLYLVVDDLAATLAKVTAAGGTIYVKPHPGGVNQDSAIIADPTGGVVALYQRGGDE